jgi:hypothetical protein
MKMTKNTIQNIAQNKKSSLDRIYIKVTCKVIQVGMELPIQQTLGTKSQIGCSQPNLQTQITWH